MTLLIILPAFCINAECSAQRYILVSADDFSVIDSANAHERSEIASLTKIMTAIVALEVCDDLQQEITVPDEAIGVEGSSIYLKPGEVMTVEDLIWAVMLNSANDAAVALAVACGGTVENFVDLMNLKAKSLCLESTHFENPNGLPADEHYSCARDLALLSCYALSNDAFRKITSSYTHYIPYCGTENGRQLVNHNRMLKMYDGCIGVKTGYTKSSGRCLVTAAEKDGVRIICVTLSDPNDWADHTALLDMGFENLVKNTWKESEYKNTSPNAE